MPFYMKTNIVEKMKNKILLGTIAFLVLLATFWYVFSQKQADLPRQMEAGVEAQTPSETDEMSKKNGKAYYKEAQLFVQEYGVFEDYYAVTNQYLHACELNHARACLRLGDLVSIKFSPTGITSDKNTGVRRAAQVWARACSLGEQRGCVSAAYADRIYGGLATEQWLKNCNSGQDYDACFYMAQYYDIEKYHYGISTPEHKYTTEDYRVNLSQKGCEGKSGLSCRYLADTGNILRGPKPVIYDLWVKGCSYNDAYSCYLLGLEYYVFLMEDEGDALTVLGMTEPDAANYFLKACELEVRGDQYGDWEGCDVLIRIYTEFQKGYLAPIFGKENRNSEQKRNLTIQKDMQSAEKIVRRLCMHGRYKSCFALGLAYAGKENLHGLVLEPDAKMALRFTNYACIGEHEKTSASCSFLKTAFDQDMPNQDDDKALFNKIFELPRLEGVGEYR